MNCKFGQVFAEIARLFKSKIEKSTGNTELTASQNAVLVFIWKRSFIDGILTNQKDIEKEFKVKASSVNSLINNLIKNNYVKKQSSTTDKRINYLLLTDKAKLLVNKAKTQIEEFEKIIINNIPKTNLEIFFDVLNQIKLNLENY